MTLLNVMGISFFAFVCSVQASYPAIGTPNKSLLEALSEVHLRRLDTTDMLHRRAVAVIAVEATPEEVWEVLTDYEALPEFVPNLALCERLPLPRGVNPRLTRLRQVTTLLLTDWAFSAIDKMSIVSGCCSMLPHL